LDTSDSEKFGAFLDGLLLQPLREKIYRPIA
jgi:hypothetical protein